MSHKAQVAGSATRWSTGCAFVDYDRDGYLDLFVTHYVDFSLLTAKTPGSNPYCVYRGAAVNCGPRGLVGETSTLYHNNRDGTFTDISAKAGIDRPSGYFGLGVLVADFDNDGWPDIYVASDSTPSLLFINNHDGTFREEGTLRGIAFSQEGREQAGMGVAAGDFDNDGWLDILKTNFSDEAPNLYHNEGKAIFNDVTAAAGLNRRTHFVGWGCGFFDPDNDGLADILYCNGHVYPSLSGCTPTLPTASHECCIAMPAAAGLKTFRCSRERSLLPRRPAAVAPLVTLTTMAVSMLWSITRTQNLHCWP